MEKLQQKIRVEKVSNNKNNNSNSYSNGQQLFLKWYTYIVVVVADCKQNTNIQNEKKS